MKDFELYVDSYYGPDEVYAIKAKNLADAKRKAKKKYAREYFKLSEIKVKKN